MKNFSLLSTKRVLFLVAILAFLIALVPPLTAAAPPRQGEFIYYVQYGDTLYSISRRFGTTVPAIMAANGLTSEYIFVGQRLIIPSTQPLPGPFDCRYTVQRRDTVYSIAYRYKVSAYALMQANYLYSPYIYVGQVLKVPCITPEPTPFPSYTVAAGDNLFRIAIQYETSIYAIALVNGIPNPNLIYTGQTLIVPYPGSQKWPVVPTVTPTLYPFTPRVLTPTWTPTATGTATTTVVVVMQNIAFIPATVTVNQGTTVMWKNVDTVNHTVTSGTPGNISGTFRSGTLTPQQTFSFTFTVPGSYPYFCEIHGAQMTGTITVQ